MELTYYCPDKSDWVATETQNYCDDEKVGGTVNKAAKAIVVPHSDKATLLCIEDKKNEGEIYLNLT